MSLQQLAADPALFQREIHVPTGSGSRRFGDVMAPFQRLRFADVNPSLLAVSKQQKPAIPRFWDERTKGGSKDTDWSVNLLWLLAFCRYPIRIQIGAYDSKQADEIRLIVRDILRINEPVNRFLKEVVTVRTNLIENTRTGATCEILTTDKFGSHGSRPDVVLINEITHQVDDQFAATLLDNLDKMPNGLGIICTNAGHDPSWQQNWKNLFSTDERWLILEYRGRPPWVDEAAWAEAQRRNTRNRFRRLFKGDWTGDTEGALDENDIDAVITQTDLMTGQERGWAWVAGLDIGLKKHSTGLVILGKHVGFRDEHEIERGLSDITETMIDLDLLDEPETQFTYEFEEPTGRLRLAYLKAWKPKQGKRVSLEAVKATILKADKRYRFHSIAVDPYQAEHLAELLEKDNLPVERTPQTVVSLQDQATATIECFQQRTIDLYDDPDLIADLKRLQTKDSGLRIRLISPEHSGEGPGTGHGDLASALSLAIVSAKNIKTAFGVSNLSRIIAE